MTVILYPSNQCPDYYAFLASVRHTPFVHHSMCNLDRLVVALPPQHTRLPPVGLQDNLPRPHRSSFQILRIFFVRTFHSSPDARYSGTATAQLPTLAGRVAVSHLMNVTHSSVHSSLRQIDPGDRIPAAGVSSSTSERRSSVTSLDTIPSIQQVPAAGVSSSTSERRSDMASLDTIPSIQEGSSSGCFISHLICFPFVAALPFPFFAARNDGPPQTDYMAIFKRQVSYSPLLHNGSWCHDIVCWISLG
jgi:hypothetical protein